MSSIIEVTSIQKAVCVAIDADVGVITMSGQPVVCEVSLKGIEKRYQPSRCYMFILQVKWSDTSEVIIYRSYSAFYELQVELLDLFPLEAGTIDESKRTIPFLPGRKIFQRTEVLKVAQERQAEIENYCKTLIQLPLKISQHVSVTRFFRATTEDINPPKAVQKKSELVTKILSTFFKGYRKKADRLQSDELGEISGPLQCELYIAIASYASTNKSTISFNSGEVMEVVDKNANGWWFVQLETKQGWAPASYLEPVDESPDQDEAEPCLGERFVAINAYKACFDDEVSFEAGVIVEVMNKSLDGWWVINYNGTVGHAPSTYLKPYENPFLDVKERLAIPTNEDIPVHNKTPPPRRCTIKNPTSKFTRKERDLTSYRKMSTRRKVNRGKKPPVPDASHLDPLYENFDGFEGHIVPDMGEYLEANNKDSIYEEIPYEEVLAREYCNSGVSEDNYLNATNLIKPCDSDSEYEPVAGGDVYDDAEPFEEGSSHAKHSYVVNVTEDTTSVPCGLVKRLKNKINENPSSPLQRQGSAGSSSGGSASGTVGGSGSGTFKGVTKRDSLPNSSSKNQSGFGLSDSSPAGHERSTAPSKNQDLGNKTVSEPTKNTAVAVKKLWLDKESESTGEKSPWKSNTNGNSLNKPSAVKNEVKPVAKPRPFENANKKVGNGKTTPVKGQLRKQDSEKEILARSGNDPEISTCLNQKLVSRFLQEDQSPSTPANVKSPVGKKPSNGASTPRFGQTAAYRSNSPAGKVKLGPGKVSTLPATLNEKPKPSPRAEPPKSATLASRIAQFEQKN